eukprot:TRINITY_DN5807_c0_g2_i2.p1 TRINITY_DN5807_c0_g2~~TRINITY_DN5807_c0_g2_i2.p1  ORF type:complete len:269 (-),score=43.00 TRINITY_DN5807_c0_g2_i2:672-1478(-)
MPRCTPQYSETPDGWTEYSVHHLFGFSFYVQKSHSVIYEGIKVLDTQEKQKSRKPHQFRIVFQDYVVATASTFQEIQTDLNYLVSRFTTLYNDRTPDLTQPTNFNLEKEDFGAKTEYDSIKDEGISSSDDSGDMIEIPLTRNPIFLLPSEFLSILEREHLGFHIGKQHNTFSWKPFEEQKQYILEHAEYLRDIDSEGRTILHYAAEMGLIDLVSFIIQFAKEKQTEMKPSVLPPPPIFDLCARDNRGWTPLHGAFHNSIPDIYNWLKS